MCDSKISLMEQISAENLILESDKFGEFRNKKSNSFLKNSECADTEKIEEKSC